jgi:alkylation response protein AidB-like acyl-CoA dehydrogenase
MRRQRPGLFVPLLPRATYDRIYRDGPDVVFAASAQPSGTATEVPGGWCVSGRWGFVSGCEDADWLGGFCVMTEAGERPAEAGGQPRIGVFLLPARLWQIEDSWHVAGLEGTGSHHIVLQDAFVPAENFLDMAEMRPCVPGALYLGVWQAISLLHGANSVGMAEGALDALLAVAQSGRQQFQAATPLRESETFQYELGRIEADVRGARAMQEAAAAEHWRHALDGTMDAVSIARAAQAAVWVTATCVRAADACFALGGGSAIYDSSSQQRWMRDLRVAAQHAAVQQRRYVNSGKELLANGRAA